MTMDAGTSSGDGGAAGAGSGAPPPGSGQDGGEGGGGLAVGRAIGEDAADDPKGEPRAKPKDAKAEAAAIARYKALINGAEVEHDGPTLAKMLSDDFEHEIVGPGGKPQRLTRKEMERLVQQGMGFERKMNALTAREQRAAEELELARKDPKARMAYMMTRLGIEDPDQFIIEAYQQLDGKRRRITELYQQGKGAEAYELQQQLIQERMERKELLERTLGQREQQERQYKQAIEQHRGKVQQAFEKQGIPFSPETFEMAEKAGKHWADLGYEKKYEDIAAEVAKELRGQFHKRLRGIPREKLLAELPEDWRRTMRELEAEAAKVAKKEERAAPKTDDDGQRREQPRDAGLSEADHVRNMRRRS